MNTICDACRAIDFGKVLKIPAEEISKERRGDDCELLRLEEDTRRFAEPESSTCALCHLLSASLCPCEDEWSEPALRDEAASDPYDLKAVSFIRNCDWTQGDVDFANDCLILLAIRGMGSSSEDYRWYVKRELGYVVCLPKERQERQFVPRVIPDRFDVPKAVSWLQSCKKNHEAPCTKEVAMIPGMRVIDCETLKIVEAESGIAWVALSYVWGEAKSDLDSTDSAALAFPQGMSRTISDAIKVTKDIGYRYIWIDRYCINQEDGAHKSNQIEQMDAIYRGADLTIITAAGQDENYGLPGVGSTRRKKQQQIVELESCTIFGTGPDPSYETQQSRWATRGWTFQEGLLSRRRLYFTDTQSWFECGNACWMEGLSGPQPCKSSDGMHATAGIKASIHGHLSSYLKMRTATAGDHDPASDKDYDFFGHYMRFIREYAKRSLTFDSDSLAAFAGVSRYLQSTGPQVSHILGIPYIPSLLGVGTAKCTLVHLLCWFHMGDSVPRRKAHFPSWTWVGWTGEVHWMGVGEIEDSAAIPKIRHLQFQEHGKAAPFEAYLRAWSLRKPQLTGRNVALCFEARVVPPTLFSLYQYTGEQDSGGAETVAFDVDSDENGNTISSELRADQIGWEEQPVYQEVKSGNAEIVRNYDITDLEESARLADDASSSATASTKSLNGGYDSDEAENSLDPQDWQNWRVGKHRLYEYGRLPDFSPTQLVEQLENGQWGCLLLADYDGNGGYSHQRFLLVVKWLADGTAVRIGSVVLHQHPYLDVRARQYFDDADLSWKSVHLL
ncbi:hypothetical protein G7054_g12666 [Neopestalotiopsis clavispora]|nr:hypothetical protein G7054_g12666 [Neopestalotiopsis clavispora]